jgi:hypothetical protein
MESTAEIAPDDRPGWPRWVCEKIGMALAILGLADLFSQQVKWAAAIDWIIADYRIAEAWLFGSLPFHIPAEWQDYISLSGILFGVTAAGNHRETRRLFVFQVFRVTTGLVASLVSILPAMLSGRINHLRKRMAPTAEDLLDEPSWFSLVVGLFCVSALLFALFAMGGSSLVGLFAAWPLLCLVFIVATNVMVCALITLPWIFSTAQSFGVLIVFNEICVRSLGLLAGH